MSDLATEQDIRQILYEVNDKGTYLSVSCSFGIIYEFDKKDAASSENDTSPDKKPPEQCTFSDSIESAFEQVVQNRGEQFPSYIRNSNGSKTVELMFDKRRRYNHRANFAVYILRPDLRMGNPLEYIPNKSLRERITDANVRMVSFNFKRHETLGRVFITADVTKKMLESEEFAAETKDYMMALCREVQEALGVAHLFQ